MGNISGKQKRDRSDKGKGEGRGKKGKGMHELRYSKDLSWWF